MNNALQDRAEENLAIELWKATDFQDGSFTSWVRAIKLARKLRFAKFTTNNTQDFIDWGILAILAGVSGEWVDQAEKDRVWVVLAHLEKADA